MEWSPPTQRPDSSIAHLVIKGGVILDTVFEAKATSEGRIADIGHAGNGAMVPGVIDGYRADHARSHAQPVDRNALPGRLVTGSMGDANERNIETAEFLLMRRIEQGGDPGVRQFTLSPGAKETRGNAAKARIKKCHHLWHLDISVVVV